MAQVMATERVFTEEQQQDNAEKNVKCKFTI